MMDAIDTIDELIAILENNEPENYVALTRNMCIPASEVERFAYWNPQRYSRNCIARNDAYELLLLCWNPGDKTPVHSHNKQRCWVHQVSGSLKEQLFKKDEEGQLEPLNTNHMESGDISYMDDSMGFHTLHNPSDNRAMSLHLYVAPIEECRVFDKEEGTFKTKELAYDSYKGKKLQQPVKAGTTTV